MGSSPTQHQTLGKELQLIFTHHPIGALLDSGFKPVPEATGPVTHHYDDTDKANKLCYPLIAKAIHTLKNMVNLPIYIISIS